MSGEKNLSTLLKTMEPKLNKGEYVFCVIDEIGKIDFDDIILIFKEDEGITVIVERSIADKLKLEYAFVASWISLTIHSSLEAVGLTAAFSKALSEKNISCNVVAGYYHDHIFVNTKDTEEAMMTLNRFSRI